MRISFALRVSMIVVVCAGCRTREPSVPPELASDPQRLGIQRREIAVGSEPMTYALIRPERVRHVLLVLPPSEARWEMVVVALQSWAIDAAAAGWAVVCPVAPKAKAPYWDPADAPSELFFVRESAELVVPLLDAVGKAEGLDVAKVFLLGIDFGGLGAFEVAWPDPERFEHVVVMPGVPSDGFTVLEALRTVPVSMVVGGDDRGWRRDSVRARRKLRRAGVSADLTIVRGEGEYVYWSYDWPALEALLLAR